MSSGVGSHVESQRDIPFVKKTNLKWYVMELELLGHDRCTLRMLYGKTQDVMYKNYNMQQIQMRGLTGLSPFVLTLI